MNSKNRLALFAFAIVLVLVVAVARPWGGKPLPPDKTNYIGEWKAPGMYLEITRDSAVHYKRTKKDSTTSINAPLQKFKGDDFSVGFLFLSTTFVVSRPPYQEGDKWKMVVDGVELTRSEDVQF